MKRIKKTDFRVLRLMSLNRRTVMGETYCSLSQTEMADILGIAYNTVNYTIKRLIDNEAIKEEHIYSAASDELIIYADELFPCDINKIKKIAEQYAVPLKFEVFKLGRVLGSSAFIKVYEDGKIKPKCVNSFELPFVMRLLRGEEVTEDDKVFYHEKRLAKYLEVPELKLEI